MLWILQAITHFLKSSRGSESSRWQGKVHHINLIMGLIYIVKLRYYHQVYTDVFCIISAPTAAPEKFQVRNSSSSSLELIWEPPPAEQTHGFIRHYLIRYKIVQCNADDVLTEASVWQSTTVESSIRSFNLTRLKFWTCYDVNISAVTVGEGPFATKRAVRTSEHG